jgi:hypothetical protein
MVRPNAISPRKHGLLFPKKKGKILIVRNEKDLGKESSLLKILRKQKRLVKLLGFIRNQKPNEF